MTSDITAQKLKSIDFQGPLFISETDAVQDLCLNYHHYSVPLCVSPKAWLPMNSPIKFNIHSNSPLTIPGKDPGDEIYSTADFSVFKREILNDEEKLIKLYTSRRAHQLTWNTELPHHIEKLPGSRGQTVGEAYLDIYRNWKDIDLLGPKRLHALLYTDLLDTGTPADHDHVTMVACPSCGEGFWQFVPNDAKLESLHQRNTVYCPVCLHKVTQRSCIGHERIHVDSFIEPGPEPPFPSMAPHELRPLISP